MNWINKHPWMTFFLASSVISGVVAMVSTSIAAKGLQSAAATMDPMRGSAQMAGVFLGRRMPRARRRY